MPVKLGLVMVKKQIPQQVPLKTTTPPIVQNAEQKGLTLRRVMNAPKTGCKSCGG